MFHVPGRGNTCIVRDGRACQRSKKWATWIVLRVPPLMAAGIEDGASTAYRAERAKRVLGRLGAGAPHRDHGAARYGAQRGASPSTSRRASRARFALPVRGAAGIAFDRDEDARLADQLFRARRAGFGGITIQLTALRALCAPVGGSTRRTLERGVLRPRDRGSAGRARHGRWRPGASGVRGDADARGGHRADGAGCGGRGRCRCRCRGRARCRSAADPTPSRSLCQTR